MAIEKERQERSDKFWLLVALGVESVIIVLMLIAHFVDKSFLYFILLIAAIVVVYLLIKPLLLRIQIYRIIQYIVKKEKADSGLNLDYSHIDNVPNPQVDRIGDEYIVSFTKEVITYLWNEHDGVYGRQNNTLYQVRKNLLENKYLTAEILKRKEENIRMERGESAEIKA